ncbi:MAG: hypothetical protein ACP5NF_00465 [Thermoanaerobaculum sp.]
MGSMDLPGCVRALLWEYDLQAQAPEEAWERVVMEKVMLRGDLEAIRFLLARFSRQRLAAFLEGRGRRVLPPRELSFWGKLCGVPRDTLREWVAEAAARERAWRG